MKHFETPLSEDIYSLDTISDGSCLFHSILGAYSSNYNSLDTDGKTTKVGNVRRKLSDRVDKDIWMSLGNGEISKNSFFTKLRLVIDDIYDYVLEKEDEIDIDANIIKEIDENKKLLKFALQKVGQEHMDGKIIPEVMNISKQGDIYFCSRDFVRLVKKYLKKTYSKKLNEGDQSKFRHIIDLLCTLLTNVSQYTINKCYSDFKERLADTSEWIDFECIPLISDSFGLNIYFIDSKTKLPYITGQDESLYDYDRRNVILLWDNENHFETVGVKEEGKKLSTTFDSSDDIIAMINMYVCNKKNAIETYKCFQTIEE